MNWRVILDLGLDTAHVCHVHDKRSQALSGVRALCSMYKCDYTEYDVGQVIIVHAEKWGQNES